MWWKSQELSDEKIKPPTTNDNSLDPALSYYYAETRLKLTRKCLKQDQVTYAHKKRVNNYVVSELGACSSYSDNPMLRNYLFGWVTLTKNADIDKYGHWGYGIGFNKKLRFSFSGGTFGQNVIIFGTYMSSFANADNKKNDILILVKDPKQGVEHTLSTEKMYLINFIVTKKKFCLSLHYNGGNSYLFVDGTEIIRFKAKNSEIVATLLCLLIISKDWSEVNMKKTGFNGYVYDFSVD